MTTEEQDNDARGGFGAKLQAGRHPALLIIDFVEACLAKGSPVCRGRVGPGRGPGTVGSGAPGGLPVIHPRRRNGCWDASRGDYH